MTAPEADNEPLRRALGKAARPKRAPSLFRSFPLRRSLEADRKLEQHVFRLRSGGELQHGLFRSSVSAILHRGRPTDVKFVKISCKASVRWRHRLESSCRSAYLVGWDRSLAIWGSKLPRHKRKRACALERSQKR